jgi:hypothetical protein
LPATLLNDFLELIEILRERLAPRFGEAACCLRAAADELFVDVDEAFFFELLQMDAQVAIGHSQVIAEFGKHCRINRGQHGHDGKPTPLVQHRVEIFNKPA